MSKKLLAWLASIAACVASVPATAANLIVNGDFELTTLAGSYEFGSHYTDGDGNPLNELTGWTTTGYNFVFAPGTASTTGSQGQYGALLLWGPGNPSNSSTYSNNGMPDASPVGGNFIGADAALNVPHLTQPISQTISNLTVGREYTLGFWWAAAQQAGYDQDTWENWTVTFGNETYATETLNTPEHQFQPWRHTLMTFTAQSSTQTLSFLAGGGPEGQPPFSLLDGVTLEEVAVPEPASWAMMLIGFGIVGAAMRNRRDVAGGRSVFNRRRIQLV